MSDDNLTLEQAVEEIKQASEWVATMIHTKTALDILSRVRPPAGVGEVIQYVEQMRAWEDVELMSVDTLLGKVLDRLRACGGEEAADCDSCPYKHPEIEGVARACSHLSSSGVDTSPTGPDKRWRCDGCGWEHYVWDRPDGISEHISPAVHDQVAALEAENGRLRGVIESKHGGEPAELLRELDAEREAHDQTRARIKALEEGLGDAVFKTTDLEARQRWLRRHDGGKGGGHE